MLSRRALRVSARVSFFGNRAFAIPWQQGPSAVSRHSMWPARTRKLCEPIPRHTERAAYSLPTAVATVRARQVGFAPYIRYTVYGEPRPGFVARDGARGQGASPPGRAHGEFV